MKIVADTNRILAALIKESTTRNILFDDCFSFVTVDYTLTEIEAHKEEIKKKTKLTDDELDILLVILFGHITILPFSDYKDFIEQCINDIDDPDDIPYLAACLASNAEGIWSHDPHFIRQKKIRVFTNIDMLRLSGRSKT